jgi:hypothetical protein
MNAWIADTRALFELSRPAFDAAKARSLANVRSQLRDLEDDPVKGLPWALTVAVSIPVALLVGVPTAGVGLGVLLGIFVSAGAAFYLRAREREAAAALAKAIADLHADADRRVELVTRQYEWAVNDVANLRDALRRARTQAAPRAEPVEGVTLARRISDTDPATTLRFAAQGIAPEQIRVLNNSVVVAISARALEPPDDADASFTIRMSEYIAAALKGGNPGFRIEALVDERWLSVDLRPVDDADAHTTEVRDKRGRVYRVPVEDAPHAILTLSVAQLS